MSLESVVRQDPPQIRVVGEVDAKHVPDFAFVPVGGLEDGVDRLDRGQLVGVGLDPDPGVEAEGGRRAQTTDRGYPATTGRVSRCTAAVG